MDTFKKGDKVLLQDGSTQRFGTVVKDGIDDQNRVRVRPQGFPMDMSITTKNSAQIYIIAKL